MSSLLHLFAQPEPPHRLIAPCFRLKAARTSRTIFALMATLFGFFLSMIILAEFVATPHVIIFPWPILFLVLMWFLQASFGYVQARYWQSIEPWRFVASLGNERLLADDQPEPRPTALPVQTKIKVRLMIERHFYVKYFAILFCSLTAFIYLSCTVFIPSHLPWPWAFLITALCSGLILLGLFFMMRMRHSMEITEDGIRIRSHYGISTLIFWHEMRLFACYPEPGARNGDEAMVYELSSGSQVIYWTWMRKKSLLNTIMGPSMSLEEHHLQMQALCSLISAKTGLLLYDLGKGPALRLEETTEAR